MQQFFISSLEDLVLSKEQEHQCTKVLRMRVSDQIRVVDRLGKACIAEFTSMKPLKLNYVKSLEFVPKKYTITLIASLIRTERLEWMIQKACECGVDRIVLLQADHGVVRGFGERTERKLERLNTIALEASEQAYRQYPVCVEGIISKENLTHYYGDLNVYADLGPGEHLMHAIKPTYQSITLIIGPEGGFSTSEVSYFNDHDFKQVSLGNSVLRAETASIIACALISAAEVIS